MLGYESVMDQAKFKIFINAVVNDRELADSLIEEDPSFLAVKNGIGETVFHYLVVEDRKEEVSYLLSKGAEINTTNEFGNTPLSEAASLGYYELCEYLLKNGADHRITTAEGDSALSEAATANKIKVVELLLNYIRPNEPLRNYFSKVTYDYLLDKESSSAKSIKLKGLKW